MHNNQQRWADDFVEESNWRREFDQAYEKGIESYCTLTFIFILMLLSRCPFKVC